jgi:MYXO-CTERM domain-containing protein
LVLYQVWGDTAVGANDTDQFPVDNANGNGTGAVDFDKVNGRVFALDSNNGLVGMAIVTPEPSTYALGLLGLGALMVHARRRSKK